jgi:hypothetical protein
MKMHKAQQSPGRGANTSVHGRLRREGPERLLVIHETMHPRCGHPACRPWPTASGPSPPPWSSGIKTAPTLVPHSTRLMQPPFYENLGAHPCGGDRRAKRKCCMLHYMHYITSMARGESGRIVIEVEPEMKRRLYATLALSGSTLKDWFVKSAADFCAEAGQLSLFARLPAAAPPTGPTSPPVPETEQQVVTKPN